MDRWFPHARGGEGGAHRSTRQGERRFLRRPVPQIAPRMVSEIVPKSRSGGTFRPDPESATPFVLRVYKSSTLSEMSSSETTTVRVRRPDSERLQAFAREHQTTVVEVVHNAIDALERQEFLHGLNDDYRKLREDPEAWEEFMAERREWDSLA